MIPGQRINWANLRMLILYSFFLFSQFIFLPLDANFSALWLDFCVMCVFMIGCMNRVLMRWVCVAQNNRNYKIRRIGKPQIRHPCWSSLISPFKFKYFAPDLRNHLAILSSFFKLIHSSWSTVHLPLLLLLRSAWTKYPYFELKVFQTLITNNL